MPLGPNYNYDLEKQQLDRRQQILDALQTSTLRPMEMPTAGPGQTQARMNPLQGAMPILQALMINQGRSDLKDQQGELADRYKQDLVNGISDFYNKSSGGWDKTSLQGPTETGDALQGDAWNYHAPDMKGAITSALASNHPVLQQMGQAGLAQMYKNDPMTQLLGLNQSGSGATPPADVLNSGQYTVNGQAPAAGATAPVGAPGSPTGGTVEDRLKKFFPFVPADQARALLASDPTGKTLAEENAHRGRLIVAGDNVFQPTAAGTVALPNGALDARKTLKQADADVTNANTLTKVNDPTTGAEVTMTQGQALGKTGGGTQPEPYQGFSLMQQLPQNVRDGILADMKSSQSPTFDLNYQLPDGRRISGTIDLSKQGASQTPGGAGFQSGMAPDVAAERKGYGEQLAQASSKIDQDAEAAMSVKTRVAEMRKDSQNFQTGSFVPMKEKLGGIAIALGADPKDVDARLGSISSMQTFNKEATNIAFDMVKSLGSREAAVVVNQAIRANANWENQPGANKAMMDVIEGMADWKLAKQQAATAWRGTHNGSLNGFETYFNQANPITNYVKVAAAAAPQPAGAPGGPTPPGRVPAGAQPSGPVQISSDADYANLPSGAEFIAPDGSHRRKP